MRRILLGTAAATALLVGVPAAASAGTLDQQQTSFDFSNDLRTTQSAAQTFTAGITGGLDQADLFLSKSGSPPATVTVEIRSTSAGKPTTTVLASGTILSSAVGFSGTFVPATFAPPAPVTAGTQYALVAYSPGSGGDYVLWLSELTGNPYPGGEVFLSNDPLPPGANWTGSPDEDFTFTTYVVPTPPTAPANTGQRAAALESCKKRARKHHWSHARLRKCKKKANLLPV